MIDWTEPMISNGGKRFSLQHFEYKPKVNFKRGYYVGSSDAGLNQGLETLRDLWLKVQSSRDRDAIYEYLTAAYELVLCWKIEDQHVQRAKRALKINGLAPPVNDPEPFAAVIAASVSPKKLDRRQLSKYARVLRFAARLNCHPRDFKRLVKYRYGGLNACAARLNRRLNRQ
jgi:hypothetical protein